MSVHQDTKVRNLLKVFETRLRGRSLKVFFGVEYLGMSIDKETGLAYMAEQDGILELNNYNTEKANADPRMKKLSEKFQKENTKVKNITTKPTIMLNSKDMWKIYLKHLTNLLAVMFKEEYGEGTAIKKINHIDIFITSYTPKIDSVL